MKLKDKESILSQIASGEFFITHEDTLFIYKEPDASILCEYHGRYLKNIRQCENEGFLTEEQEKEMLEQHKIWFEKDEEKARVMLKDIKTLQSEKSKNRFRSREIKRIDRTIGDLMSEIEAVNDNRRSFTFQTARYQAEIRSRQWLLHKCLMDENRRMFWCSWEDFEEDVNMVTINELMALIFWSERVVVTEMRELARSEPWRSSWRTSCKTGSPVFNRPTSEHTELQKSLSYWSIVYDNVYESLECPDTEVIENDEALDEWFLTQQGKQENRRSESADKTSTLTSNKKIAGSSEIFMPVDSEEDAKKVYEELNSPEARAKMREQDGAVKEHGSVKEADLPSVKRDLRMKATQASIRGVKGK